jgi:type IV secretion system protein TrbL
MKIFRIHRNIMIVVVVFSLILLFTEEVLAQKLQSKGIMDDILLRYSNGAKGWARIIQGYASTLFWSLTLISMVWTFGFMSLRQADIGEFFAEFIRFIFFTGLFWWLLINGPDIATSIMNSLKQVGAEAAGFGRSDLSPSGIIDIGISICYEVIENSSKWSPVDSLFGGVLGILILGILALISVNMLLLLAASWVLAYGGVFFLGFGGSRWTSDIAFSYFRTVFAIAVQLMTMVLIVGIGKTFLYDYYSLMRRGIYLKEMVVMGVVVLILYHLVNKLPPMVSGILTGASLNQGVGGYGVSHAIGAAAAAYSAAMMGAGLVGSGISAAASAASSLFEYTKKAEEELGNVSAHGHPDIDVEGTYARMNQQRQEQQGNAGSASTSGMSGSMNRGGNAGPGSSSTGSKAQQSQSSRNSSKGSQQKQDNESQKEPDISDLKKAASGYSGTSSRSSFGGSDQTGRSREQASSSQRRPSSSYGSTPDDPSTVDTEEQVAVRSTKDNSDDDEPRSRWDPSPSTYFHSIPGLDDEISDEEYEEWIKARNAFRQKPLDKAS